MAEREGQAARLRFTQLGNRRDGSVRSTTPFVRKLLSQYRGDTAKEVWNKLQRLHMSTVVYHDELYTLLRHPFVLQMHRYATATVRAVAI